MSIEHGSEVPVYRQLAAILRDKIKRGELTRRVPSLKSLAQEYGVAHGTAEKALRVLRDEGLIRSVIGLGAFVVPEDERRG